MQKIDRRIADLERQHAQWSGPLVVFEGDDEDVTRLAVEHAERIGRPVIRWPVCRPRIGTEKE